MVKRMVLMLLVVGLVLGGVFGFQAFKSKMIAKAMADIGNQAQTVSTGTADVSDWQPEIVAVGSLRAVNGADLASEVGGIVETISFQSGDDVKAGTVLLQLRAEDDIGRLRSLEAAAELAAITYDRDMRQLKLNAISQAQVDNDAANLKSARAQVAEQQAIVAKKTLKAPFDGRLGIRSVDLGQYLAAGTTVVTLQALDPIFLDFLLPQQELARVREGQAVQGRVDTFPNEEFSGMITAINSRVDPATRNIQVRASFANPDRKMLPGMFARVRIAVGAPQQLVTVPQTAITYNPYGDTVYVVSQAENAPAGQPAPLTVQQVFVTLGSTRGDQVAVVKGLERGATIVTSGQSKLRNGARVTVNNSVTPANEPNPKPSEDEGSSK